MAKTFIAVPCMDQVPAQFAYSLATLNKPGEAVVGFQIGSLVYNSRNELARKAVACGSDFTLWLDSDMVFGQDLLIRLMAHMEDPETDFVTGVYFRRTVPYTPVIMDKLELTETGSEWHDLETLPDEPFEVAGCGFGGVLMRTGVLFDVMTQTGSKPFDPIRGTGEDLSFCWRARQLGHRIICDPRIDLGHMGHMAITKEFAQLYRAGRQ